MDQEFTLTSGNVLYIEHASIAGRGGVRGSFRDEPSEADMAEGKRLCEAQVPPGGRITRKGVADVDTARRIMSEHLAEGMTRH